MFWSAKADPIASWAKEAVSICGGGSGHTAAELIAAAREPSRLAQITAPELAYPVRELAITFWQGKDFSGRELAGWLASAARWDRDGVFDLLAWRGTRRSFPARFNRLGAQLTELVREDANNRRASYPITGLELQASSARARIYDWVTSRTIAELLNRERQWAEWMDELVVGFTARGTIHGFDVATARAVLQSSCHPMLKELVREILQSEQGIARRLRELRQGYGDAASWAHWSERGWDDLLR